MNHGSLFSGLGGFDLAARWVGWENSFHSDIDPFCLTVLKHHFPNATTYTDIRDADFTPWRDKIDILSGGFPCQPFSQAGKRQGTDDSRHLWPEMLRAIREIRPRWVVGENVLGITNWNGGLVFEQVCSDLEAENYSVQPFIIPACGVNAPHQRYRTWFIAHRNDDELFAGIEFEEWLRQALIADGGDDARHTNGHGACPDSGAAGGQSSESGGVCGTDSGRANTDRADKRAVADPDDNGYERRDESLWKEGGKEEEWRDQNFDVAGSRVQRTSADTNGIRPENLSSGSDGENDYPNERGNILGGTSDDGAERIATDSECGRGCERREDVQPEESNGERFDRDGGEWDVADTDCRGLEGANSIRRNSKYVEREDRTACQERQSADPYGQMSQCGDNQGEKGWDFEGFGTESFGGTFSWQEFPTKSPVCGGNDGVSELLHGITFPRWRKESIKAYGNAIVPQVAYRIFRVINYMSTGE